MTLGFGLFDQSDVRETPAGSSSSTSSTSILAPIGSIMPWLKSYTNTPPTLPTGWVECDGSAISDADSVYNGQNLPDLNGGEFLRGAATSGGTGGGTTGAGSAHNHSITGSVSAHAITEAEMPAHIHTLTNDVLVDTSTNAASGSAVRASTTTDNSLDTDSKGSGSTHTHADNFAAGNESTHTHSSSPKYYDVVWIMRIK